MNVKERIARAIAPDAWDAFDKVENEGYKPNGMYGDMVLRPVRESKEAAERVFKEIFAAKGGDSRENYALKVTGLCRAHGGDGDPKECRLCHPGWRT